jgi:hypothetical protein
VSFIPRLLHAINQLLSLTKELPKQWLMPDRKKKDRREVEKHET